ncbi:outer membrane lipoprotein carrier protein LolA [Vaginella massiliensis]|uniref:LolA family protein n=1 Tax=Vaginella massiliensis TaxID=1816680 RepID=UPI0037513ECB
MKAKVLLISLMMTGFWGFAQTPMSTVEITKFKREVTQEVRNLKTYSADFTETKNLSFLKKPSVSSGKMYMKSPNKVLWQYTKPATTTLFFSDKTIYITQAGKKKSTDLSTNKQFGKLNDLVLNSFNGNLFDSKEFSVTFLKKADLKLVKLSPVDKQMKKYMKEVILTFEGENRMVSQVKMVQPNNDYTLITFSNRKSNPTLDENLFK